MRLLYVFKYFLVLLFFSTPIYSSFSLHLTNSSLPILWKEHKVPSSSIPVQSSMYCYQQDKTYTYYSGNATISRAIHFQEGSVLVRGMNPEFIDPTYSATISQVIVSNQAIYVYGHFNGAFLSCNKFQNYASFVSRCFFIVLV